jgi:hypothetical protein
MAAPASARLRNEIVSRFGKGGEAIVSEWSATLHKQSLWRCGARVMETGLGIP